MEKCEFLESELINTANIWALTMINEGSEWPEIAPIQNKYVEEITKLVDKYWFNRYSRPLYYLHENGWEFIGEGFEEMLENYWVQS